MRVLRIDLSNKLTNYGVELIYRKLFDPLCIYNQAFFKTMTKLKKLRLYAQDGSFVESATESFSYNIDKYLQFEYNFKNLPSKTITNIVLEDTKGRILDLDLQHISLNDYQQYFSNLEKITCRFIIDRSNNQIRSMTNKTYYLMPLIITDYGIQFIYKSLANVRNVRDVKINYFYSGEGEADLTGSTPYVSKLLDDIKFSKIIYSARNCIVFGKKLFSYNTTNLTELGLGFYLNPKRYMLHTLAAMDKKDFYDDSKKCDSIWSLVYDDPIASYRISSDDYRCVFLGKYQESAVELFNNRAFEVTFEINLIYSILYDMEQIAWEEDENSYEIREETILLSDKVYFSSLASVTEHDS